MNKYDSNDIMECFKMSVDLKKVKEIEEYVKQLEQENNQLKEQRQELRSWLEEYYDYSDCIKIKSVLKKLNELEGVKDE